MSATSATRFTSELAKKLKGLGFSLRRVGAQIFISPAAKLTDEQRLEVRRGKAGLLASLDAYFDPDFDSVPWNQEQADFLVSLARKKTEGRWPDGDDRIALGVLCDRADVALLNRNLGLLHAEVVALLAGWDACLPKRVGNVVHYEPPAVFQLFNGWMRLGKKTPWLAVITECGDFRACGEALNDYAKLHKTCDIAVLPYGLDPNRKD